MGLKKIISSRFLQKPGGFRGKRLEMDPILRSLTDRNGQVVPKCRPLLGKLDALAKPQHVGVIKRALKDLQQKDHEPALRKWNKLVHVSSDTQITSFQELAEKHHAYGPQILENLIEKISELESDAAASFFVNYPNYLDFFAVPKVVKYKLSRDQKDDSISFIHALAKKAKTPLHFQAVSLAISKYFSMVKPVYSELTLVLDPLDSQIKPKLTQNVCRELHVRNSQTDLISIYELFLRKNVSLSAKGMSTFLRALFTQTDQGAVDILKSLQTTTFSLGFYYFLVKRLCDRKDEENVNWIFTNRLMPLMEKDSGQIPLVLNALMIRTVAFEGVLKTKPILDAMGSNVTESSWMCLFQAFRRLGTVEKSFDTLNRAIMSFDIKLSLPFVNEYLWMISENYTSRTFLQVLEAVVPEITPVIDKLNLAKNAHSMHSRELPPVVLGPQSRAFVVNRIHESWLHIAYRAVLNDIDDPKVVLDLYKRFREYVLDSNSPIGMCCIDEFVTKLTTLPTQESVNAAVFVYTDALENLRFRSPNDGRFHGRSLHALTSRLASEHDLETALKLVEKTASHRSLALRGKSLRKLYYILKEDVSPQNAKIFEEWTKAHGALLCRA